MWEFLNPFIFFISNVGKMWENKKITRFIKYQSLLFQHSWCAQQESNLRPPDSNNNELNKLIFYCNYWFYYIWILCKTVLYYTLLKLMWERCGKECGFYLALFFSSISFKISVRTFSASLYSNSAIILFISSFNSILQLPLSVNFLIIILAL